MHRAQVRLIGAVAVMLLAAGTAWAGYYPRPAYHGVDHGQAIDCWDCHWFDAENAFNALRVSPLVIGAGESVYSVSYLGWQDMVKEDRTGICQVCHTQTKYWGASYDWQYPGWPGLHFPEDNCLSCHPHWQPENLFRPQMKGPQSHATHLTDCKGPRLPDCMSCHYEGDYSRFLDGQTIGATSVCDPCHSPDGPVDGVNDPVVGAKPNWLHGVYDGGSLRPDLEHWCDTCHDSGTSVVDGVQAPDVVGDNFSYGYNVSGHGRNPQNYVPCLDCHTVACPDSSYEHCDGEPRTYTATPGGSNYVPGYRLKAPMNIPRDWARPGQATDYALCLNCHDSAALFDTGGLMMTNFRNDISWVFPSKNLHYLHLIEGPFSHGPLWDSDWNGANFNDSPASCPACHNVHGSPTPKMTRHGELMGLGSVGLDFRWYEQDFLTQTGSLAESRWGAAELSYSANRICVGCHGTYSDRYFRLPYEVLVPTPGAPSTQPLYNGLVWTSDLANNPKSVFKRGSSLKVHCLYYVCPFNPVPPYEVTRNGSITGTVTLNLAKSVVTQGEGVYEVVWTKTIPADATPGQAKIKTLVKTNLAGVDYLERQNCTIEITR